MFSKTADLAIARCTVCVLGCHFVVTRMISRNAMKVAWKPLAFYGNMDRLQLVIVLYCCQLSRTSMSIWAATKVHHGIESMHSGCTVHACLLLPCYSSGYAFHLIGWQAR